MNNYSLSSIVISFRKPVSYIFVLVVAMIITACTAQYPLNPQTRVMPAVDNSSDSIRHKLLPSERSESFLLMLAFSGGGTRASSLSYGILEALERIDIPLATGSKEVDANNKKHTLLDEVDVISGVSGGSFTAAYYGLHGKNIFRDYRGNFLIQDFQGSLMWSFLNPINWFKLWSPRFGRSDMAEEYYDYALFKGAKLGDLSKGGGPTIIIQATDATEGYIFSFSPSMFYLICSDYEEFPVARAVAASAAFPGPLSPIVLKNYAGQCNYPVPDWISKALDKHNLTDRAYFNAVQMSKYLNPEEKPYIYLVDGGVSDNLGIRGPLESIINKGSLRDVLKEQGMTRTRRVAIIIVDAQTKEQDLLGLHGKIPGLSMTLGASSGVMINKFNFETIELLTRYTQDWAREDEAHGEKPIEFYIVHVTFDALPDKGEQEYFQSIPTTLKLPAEQVDKLREVAGRLLYSDEKFQKLVTNLGGKIPEPPKPETPSVAVPQR
jgi:NTE family protein